MASLFDIPNVEIKVGEYRELLRNQERLECLKCYLNACKIPDIETIRIIAGCEEMEIVYE